MVDTEHSAQDITIPRMTSYLELNGWERVLDNTRWRVFHGRKSKSGKPFEIALPKDVIESDYRLHIQHAIRILSSLERQTWESTRDEIVYHDRDLLRVRILTTADRASLPYDAASKYVRYMKKLIQYSASSESKARAHFKQPLSTGAKMIQHFRFGQTFKGSFGLLVESPVGEEKRYTTRARQQTLRGEEYRILPLERRVLERIARGVKATVGALKDRNAESLKEGYGEGFNSRMCEAVRDMVRVSSHPYELSISWSKKLRPSAGVADFIGVRLGHEHLEYLDTAIDHLKLTRQDKATITGRVIALSSSGDPMSDAVDDRAIIMDAKVDQPRGRKVSMNLNKTDYIQADKAHMNWDTVSVSGLLQKKGSIWHLSDARDFRVLPRTGSDRPMDMLNI